MATTSKGSLKPRSKTDPRYGRIKKVFMAYIHNPDPYEQYIPPYTRDQLKNPAIYRQALREKTEHSTHQLDKIHSHKATVRRLIESLVSGGVAVSHDQLHEGEHVTNLLKYYEEQIIDSDAVLLIITKSLNYYMSHEAPIGENEILLTRHFLHNLMTIKKPSGTSFIPIFINQPVDRGFIPTTLASSTCYSVREPFDVRSGDLSDLYAYLTNQNTGTFVGPAEVITIPGRRKAYSFVPKQKTQGLSPEESKLYSELCQRNTPLPEEVIFQMISDIAPKWKKLAEELSLLKRDILQCGSIASSSGEREACYQILLIWRNGQDPPGTIALFAKALYAIGCSNLFYSLAFYCK